MCNIPKDCDNCIYSFRCDTALNEYDCRFCGLIEEKVSLTKRLKNYFGKLFK